MQAESAEVSPLQFVAVTHIYSRHALS